LNVLKKPRNMEGKLKKTKDIYTEKGNNQLCRIIVRILRIKEFAMSQNLYVLCRVKVKVKLFPYSSGQGLTAPRV
jgi:hypothetical protein